MSIRTTGRAGRDIDYGRISSLSKRIGAALDSGFNAKSLVELNFTRNECPAALSILALTNVEWTFRPGKDKVSPCSVFVDFRTPVVL